jgi:hypothetical protein
METMTPVAPDGTPLATAAGMKGTQRDAALTPVAGYQQLTLGAAANLVPPATSTIAVINVEGGGMRYRDDGSAATTTTGMLYPAGTTISVTLANLAAVSLALDSGSGAGKANVSYYR